VARVHAFRRGLATNLHRSSVPDKTIQAILRHSNVAVTQACYIKTVPEDAVAAMRLLECAPTVQLPGKQVPDQLTLAEVLLLERKEVIENWRRWGTLVHIHVLRLAQDGTW
jgi:hypothetical protein